MNNQLADRKYIVIGIIVFIGIVYIFRLFYLQIIDESLKLDAKNQAFRYVTQYPPRGYIFDRKGKLLVFNEAAYDLMVLPKQVKNIDTALLCRIIGIDRESFMRRMKKAVEKPNSPRKPSIFEKQISAETYAALQEKLYRFKGFFVQSRTLRKYPYPTAAHLLGYVGEVDKAITDANPYYKDGDYIGISGIEKSYEEELRGKKGVKIMMVDVHNREKGSFMNGIYDTLSIPGKGLTCTLDRELQRYGELLMQNKFGSAVAIEPSTGEILALVTSPTYDPNLLVGRTRSKNYAKLALDTIAVPLYNRALMASYPPGSTFKLIDALIAQQEGVLNPETRYPCARGYPPLGGKPKCHPHSSPLALYESISHSCNSYYSYVFKSIVDNDKYHSTTEGFEAWRNYALSFGVGRKLNTDLPNELRGLVPTVKYYDKVFGKGSWKSSTVISLGIGQAELLITPLQNANVVATIANRGFYYIPHIIKAINNNPDHPKLQRFKQKQFPLVTDTAYFNNVVKGMAFTVESGTGASVKIKDITMCGKTGTAQNPHGKDHSVFVAFAPKDNPKIAVAVLVENAGFGAAWAAPIASLMIEKYIRGYITRPDMEKRMFEGNLIENVMQTNKKKN
ncbi:MAG: penicillin-binding protein 2 [Bacteroidetes bacterium]|nr:penicillin-binding protein 2 [Bacteroidota bacterium]